MVTMAQSPSAKQPGRAKKTLGKLLLPNKIPNKVGVLDDARCSPLAVSRRPLSLDVASLSIQDEHLMSKLRRCSSASDCNLDAVALAQTLPQPKIERSLSEHAIMGDLSRPNSSTDSLARKALLAAQVLNLIPVQKARARNFLQGRTGPNSMLGKAELDKAFPNRDVKIFVGTWNMNGRSPPRELNDFVLPVGLEYVPDILAFGTQESCSEKFDWESSLQETLGPSHVLFHSTSLGTLHLVIFVRRDLIWYCSVPEEANMSVRHGTAFKTKGAVACAFMLFGTSFLFVTAHLTAHEEKVKERVSDVKRIVNSLDLPRNLPIKTRNKDATQNFDYVFWCGDLNFRLATPRAKVLEWLSNTSFPLPAHLPHGYLHHDQLCSVLADGAAFKGFCEANITFPPTYKYDPGTQNFDTSSKQRTPAYTDRILYKQKATRRLSGQLETQPLQCLVYDSVPSITTSDHKPVWGVFKAHLRPGIDTIPLAAGMFNREVYLEGIQRRAKSMHHGGDGSSVCSLQ